MNDLLTVKGKRTVQNDPASFNFLNEPYFHFPLEFNSEAGKGKIKVIGKKDIFPGNFKKGVSVTVEGQLERPRFVINGKDMTAYQIRAVKVELKVE